MARSESDGSENEILSDLEFDSDGENATAYEFNQRRNVVYTHGTEEQINRMTAMINTTFDQTKLKRLIKQILGVETNKLTLSVSVAAKVFIGELVERALEVAADEGHSGAILPQHLNEARRRFFQEYNIE